MIAQSEQTVQEAVADYRSRGLAVCRLQPGKKRPTYKEWNLRSLELEDFRDDDNVGIITGRLSGDLVCVDLDASEALEKADDFLPPTAMIDGRSGKPRSHWWYRVTDIPSELASPNASGGMGGPLLKHFQHPETGTNLIDFLGTGGQAAVPPSFHPSDERRLWHGEGEPAVVSMRELWEAVCRLAEACGWKANTRKQGRCSMSLNKGASCAPSSERLAKAELAIRDWPLAESGKGGHATTYSLACHLIRDLGLTIETARPLFDRYNERLAEEGEETWEPEELDHKLRDAAGSPAQNYYAPPLDAMSLELARDPHRLAEEFVAGQRWVCWNGLYFRYDGRKYEEIPERELRALLTAHIKQRLDAGYAQAVRQCFTMRPTRLPAPPSVTCGSVRNTLQALESLTTLPGKVPMPGQLPDGQELNHVALINGLFDLDAGQLRPHSPDWFSTVCLPYAFEPEAKCELWLTMLNQNLENDTERVRLLQEFFGYCLVRSTDAQAFLVLVGEGGNGKSVVLAGLHALLGEENVATVPLEDFGKKFALFQTLGKLANICAEIGELDKTAEGTLKAFVSGDRMTFERKTKDPFTARPTARLVLSTNNVPRFADRTEGVWRRLRLVPFNRRVPDAERVAGMDKPEWWVRAGELPGMFNWALEGLRRLRTNNFRFTEPAACRAALDVHRLESDPCRTFLTEHFTADSEAAPIPTSVVYQQYQKWCEENGHKHPLSAQAFGRQVRRVFQIGESRTHRFRSGSQKAWFGLAGQLHSLAVTDVTAA